MKREHLGESALERSRPAHGPALGELHLVFTYPRHRIQSMHLALGRQPGQFAGDPERHEYPVLHRTRSRDRAQNLSRNEAGTG